ncbi:pentatricopeptide repeat-containing protein At1g08070, chloroplastic-like [Magnolia sinica]|uniref:pentatricopeptide repeat-containing protein At1g08070, chloroplastic-like n=1 Tax=Magnolia sinica TaxID=86752 RepID=UPI00265AE6B0|nr:pentatricopeptide repeat-containing protein At1g08070, chloroplastic-like [Magnolia sinica]
MKDVHQIHAQMIVTGFIHHTPSLTKLISHSLSADPTSLTYACMVFNHIHQPNIVIWNTIIRGFVDHSFPKVAILGYVEMLQESKIIPDRITFPSLLKGCAQLLAFNEGKILHGQIVRLDLDSDLYIQTTLVKMYAACGDLNSARIVFEKMGTQKNQVAWTTMISGYARNHYPKEALILFNEMEKEGLEPDEVTMVSVLSACGDLKDLDYGKNLHFHIDESGMKVCVVLGTALLDMYAKCGELDLARHVFDALPERNVVAWSAMVSGYSQNNCGEEALRLFKEMVFETNQKPNEITILAVISACAQSGDLNLGRWIHAYISKAQLNPSISLQNSLIDMYSKCGQIDVAHRIFYGMPEKDIVSWNTMINGLALHGLGVQALDQFSIMLMSGIRPDDITFIGVLSACSHAGLVLEGRQQYQNMRRIYGIVPKLEHYGCMVDLLSRAGLLQEAENFIQEMPMEPNGAIWGALLSACRVYNNVEFGKKAAKRLLDIEPDNDGVYVLLSNIFAGQKQWAEARKVRSLMHERGIRKMPGCSSIVVDGIAHEFLVGDRSHPESENIYLMLNHVIQRLKSAGYAVETSEVLLNIDEEEKEDSVSQHSEKLAICFGLMKTMPGTEMLIMKNLRVCGDCHSAIKYISKVFQREIIVRDRSRFHHFKDGSCSCRDYW